MIQDLVSIIIPTFNCREWICDAIESSLNQTYKYCEIIVIDDGSTDGTAITLESRYKHRLTYIYQQNMGLSGARNRGIDAAHGEFIQFLDSDDIITADKIEIQVNALKNVHGYGVSYSDYCSIDINNNSILERRYLSPKTNTESFFYSVITDWETRFSVPVHCFLFKSSLFLDHNIKFDVLLPNHEDWDCWVRVFSLNPKVIYVNKKLAIYRIRSSSICSNRALMRYGFLESLNKYLQKHSNDPDILALLINKKNEMEECYRDVSSEAIRSTAMQMAAKNELLRMPVVEAPPSPRLIAFHLPQFHTIPENDEWWGNGFTEWTNVSKATPLFPGHYQPHIPSDLGYYDLSNPDTLKAQAALAKEYGIHGFCYYHYWFNGKLLLETPLHQMLKSGEPDFPFCLCWANEDWTRAWDGRSGDVLIGQNYNDSDDIRHFYYLLSFFEDKRYIRINGKPLFLVYRANRLPDPVKTTNSWRELAIKMGIGELYLCRVESFSDEHTDPTMHGFDSSVEFQPDWRELRNKLTGDDFGAHSVYDYADVVKSMLMKQAPTYKRFPCVTPCWDNSPRRKSDAVIFINSTPELYKNWLYESIRKVQVNTPDERIIFINAWNEWGEGNHLEPDLEYGRAYLEATKAALDASLDSIESMNAKPVGSFKMPVANDSYIVSIIIPVFNKLDYTRRCIKAIIQNTSNIHFEVIIIDNASIDGTKEYLEGLSGDIKIITNPDNVGYTIACNQGARIASGRYLVFLNNDTEPQFGWLESLLQLACSDSSIGAVGAKLVYPDGSLQEAGGIIFRDARGANFGRGDDPAKPQYNLVCEVDYCSGACLMVSRDAFFAVGGFDQRYAPAYYEDTDLCFALRKHGFKVLYCPQAVVVHYEYGTSGDNPNDGFRKYLAINKIKFIEKWKNVLEDQDKHPSVSGSRPSTADRKRLLGSGRL